MLRAWLSAVVISALAACGTDNTSPMVTTKVYKYRGSLQCTGGGTAPAVMSTELTNAGVDVQSFSCGNDGLGHPAVCGASDGAINIFEIPEGLAAQAQSLSFQLLSTLPTAVEVPCP
jgi:hypothetical protein